MLFKMIPKSLDRIGKALVDAVGVSLQLKGTEALAGI